MEDWVIWLIIAGFYAPPHFVIPALVGVMRADSDDSRKQAIRNAIIDAGVSMVVAFVLLLMLGMDRLEWTLVILMLSLPLPYIRVFKAAPVPIRDD